ncbi:MAG: oligopeptide/dipeptide ABC transporter ATP-binding protein, partial [Myxococcota bacterium]
LKSMPARAQAGERLHEIPGVVPSPRDWPAGCRFSTRCERVIDRCRVEVPGATELSGGLKQRVMIAMALSLRPKLLIADEPTTALDVTIQAQILELMRELQRESSTAILLITHDLGVVNELADRIAVMYAGRIVEQGDRETVLARARHPYTQGLLRSIPSLAVRGERLAEIAGVVPQPVEWPEGCRFSTRCPRVEPRCRGEMPELLPLEPGHTSRCLVVAEEATR